jgi:hypothetical protein
VIRVLLGSWYRDRLSRITQEAQGGKVKRPHAQAKLLYDLTKHVMTVNPGSEPFALGLRAIGDAAWEMLNARGVEWAAIGSKTGYVYRVHSYTASPDMASKAHRDALAMSGEMGATTANLSRHDRTVNLVLNAERRLAALTEPLPPSLHEKLQVSRDFLRVLLIGKVRNKATVREALREKLYTLCPSRRPRKKAVGD